MTILPFVPWEDADSYSGRDYRKAVRRGIEDVRVSPHTCRHFFAQQHVKMGTDLYTISRLLGHENIQITQTYLKSLRDRDIVEIAKSRSVLMAM